MGKSVEWESMVADIKQASGAYPALINIASSRLVKDQHKVD